jgi:hypothetical protein
MVFWYIWRTQEDSNLWPLPSEALQVKSRQRARLFLTLRYHTVLQQQN